MLTQEKTLIQLLRSNQIIRDASSPIAQHFGGDTYPKLPEASQLDFGELALNLASGHEIIAIKNSSGKVVYLPFNVATRLVRLEQTVDDVDDYVMESVSTLSAMTVSTYNSLSEFESEMRAKISYILELIREITISGGTSGSTSGMTSFVWPITYEGLVALKNEGELIGGVTYRILNYQATVNNEIQGVSTRIPVVQSGFGTSMGFDILMKALSNDLLDENVMLAKHDADIYFQNCDVQSWTVKYCLENDTSRFNWAKEGGFGVIYYMKDNYANEAYYDFKNIVFVDGSSNKFTFNHSTSSKDLSVIGNASGNVIKPLYGEASNNKAVQMLNKNIFSGQVANGNITDVNAHDIKLDGDFISCHISPSCSETTIVGPLTNRSLGYICNHRIID